MGEHYEHFKYHIIHITYPSHLKTFDTSLVKMLLDKPCGTSLFHLIASSKLYTQNMQLSLGH